MKRTMVFTSVFSKVFDRLVASGVLREEDFERLEQDLLHSPKKGDVIPGLGGLRKIRLKSFGKGKSGGFRIDYLDFPEKGVIYFVVIYPKNMRATCKSPL